MHHFDQEMLPIFLQTMDQSSEALSTGENLEFDKEELTKDML